MTEKPTRTEAGLAALPAAVAPPADLWPGIEARLDVRGASGEVLGIELARDFAPPERLWPAIEARLGAEAGVRPLDVLSRWTAGLAAAAVVAFAVLGIHGSGGIVGPDRDGGALLDIWWLAPDAAVAARSATPAVATALDEARRTYRDTILAVRDQRVALESLLGQYPDDAALRELWRYTYRTELRLIDEGGRVITDLKLRYES